MSFYSVALAQPVSSLGVQFVPDPLFVQANFLPLDETSGTVTVTNNGDASKIILTEAINILDNNNFGSLLHLTIKEGNVILFNNTLANFFSNGEVSLGVISNGTPRTFIYTISFINSDDNSYQGKTLGFDVCVGFEGGQTHCGNTVIGDEENTDNGGGGGGGGTIPGSGGGGGGGSFTPITLTIFNERASNVTSGVDSTGTALITWNTNLLATSQVVYGLASSGPYTLNLTPPNFGYPSYTTEDPTKVINHGMQLTGLLSGQTYVYRVISRASPHTISPEFQFTMPLLSPFLAQGGGNSFTGNNPLTSANEPGIGEILDTSPAIEETPAEEEGLGLLASAIASGFGDILSFCTLLAFLILLAFYLIWKLWLRRKYEKDLIKEEEIKIRFWFFFGGLSLLAILVFIIFRYYCPLPVFIISFAISVCFYTYLKLKVK